MPLSKIQRRLIDAWQRDFPLLRDPYAHMAFELGVSELYLLGMIKQLIRENILSRVGAVVAPNTAGASVLAAIAAPAGRLEEVAAVVNAEPGVNHNYEREHRYNLWFVVTGRDRRAVDAAIARIQDAAGLDVLTLPLRTAYHIDLGFPLDGSPIAKDRNGGAARSLRDAGPVSRDDRALLRAIEDGLPVAPRPFEQVGHAIGSEEDDVIARLGGLIDRGIIKRFGLVVRHRELGYSANAMVVWDVNDGDVDHIGETFAQIPFVTLCYRRPRRLPDWPYNLFCMIHGRDRDTVRRQIETLKATARTETPMAVLFSGRRFKQRGARLSAV